MAFLGSLRQFQLSGIHCKGREVGRGSYATILEYNYRGLTVVGKKIHPDLYKGVSPAESTEVDVVKRYKTECELLGQLRHPNIVQFLGIYNESGSILPVLVMEYLPLGSLSGYLEKVGEIPNHTSYGILRDVALGLRYLHEHTPPIVHRDLSANNILLTTSLSAKISDLGMAKILNLSVTKMMSTKAPGTLCYMAPEALADQPSYNESIDSFAFGVVSLHTLCSEWPFPTKQYLRQSENPVIYEKLSEVGRRAKYLKKLGDSHPLGSLICKCLSCDPKKRPTASDILKEIQSAAASDQLEPLMRSAEHSGSVISKSGSTKARTGSTRTRRSSLYDPPPAAGETAGLDVPAQLTCIDAPQGMSRGHAVATDSSIFVGGGIIPGTTKDDHTIFCYSLADEMWHRSLPRCPVRYFGLVHFNGRLVTVGGKDQQRTITGKLYSYCDDRVTPIWKELIEPMPTPRYCISAVVTTTGSGDSPALLVAGGATKVSGSQAVLCSAVELYRADQWCRVDPLPSPCWCMSAVAIGDACYLLGGNDDTKPLKECFRVSLASLLQTATTQMLQCSSRKSVWRRLPPTPLIGSTAASIGGSLVAVGGENDRDAASQAVHTFVGGAWVRLSGGDLSVPQSFATAALVSSNEVVIIGGDRQAATWHDISI